MGALSVQLTSRGQIRDKFIRIIEARSKKRDILRTMMRLKISSPKYIHSKIKVILKTFIFVKFSYFTLLRRHNDFIIVMTSPNIREKSD